MRGLTFGVWGLGFGVWSLGFGVWGLGFGVWVFLGLWFKTTIIEITAIVFNQPWIIHFGHQIFFHRRFGHVKPGALPLVEAVVGAADMPFACVFENGSGVLEWPVRDIIYAQAPSQHHRALTVSTMHCLTTAVG